MEKEEKIKLIGEILAERNIHMPEDVIDMLAASHEYDLKDDLVEIVIRIMDISDMEGVPITLTMANEALIPEIIQFAREMSHVPCPPIFEAIEKDLVDEVARLITSEGADVESVSSRHDGMTPLILACELRNDKIVQLLLESGSNPNNDGEHFASAIHVAIRSPMIMELLLKSGANPNAVAEDYITPLMLAAESDRYLPQIKLLLAHGADPKLVNDEGETALLIAEANDAQNVISFLKEALDKDLKNN